MEKFINYRREILIIPQQPTNDDDNKKHETWVMKVSQFLSADSSSYSSIHTEVNGENPENKGEDKRKYGR